MQKWLHNYLEGKMDIYLLFRVIPFDAISETVRLSHQMNETCPRWHEFISTGAVFKTHFVILFSQSCRKRARKSKEVFQITSSMTDLS